MFFAHDIPPAVLIAEFEVIEVESVVFVELKSPTTTEDKLTFKFPVLQVFDIAIPPSVLIEALGSVYVVASTVDTVFILETASTVAPTTKDFAIDAPPLKTTGADPKPETSAVLVKRTKDDPVKVPENVLSPENVWVPVDTSPDALDPANVIEFTEVDTMDIGSTTAVGLTMILSGSNTVLTGSSSTGAWTIRTIIRTITRKCIE